ncbi:hypothetical protein B4092_3863 [Bacillus licheniformis]|nr:hypothetical protein B4092_3863 [Bacillus licheniformis]TWN84105.1 hypothetical protein CHCC20491_4012 [Bacillus paralicheniformis]KYC97886.1 hypothetical protein B4164_3673 [Bacillus licheniformis]TWJ70464.1 hypothetical protein CHCC5020_0513 [Bacillus licheniformis]TWL14443.1 hypothetical protein CHCC16874_2798 [Bacillus licheniformis]
MKINQKLFQLIKYFSKTGFIAGLFSLSLCQGSGVDTYGATYRKYDC